MLLVIDAGNTNTVFAIFDGEDLRGQWRIVSDGKRTSDEYAVWLKQLLQIEGIELKDIYSSIISTVVPAALFNLRQLCSKYLGHEALLIGAPTLELGMEVHIDEPSTVGADRLANAVGAHIKYPGDLIVVDFGTATTFDLISKEGNYEGGIIAPGVNLSVEALHQAAAKLPHIAIERPERVVGKNTVTAMKSGVYWGYIGLIEGLINRMKAENGPHLKVIATGGLSRLFRHGTTMIDVVDEDLTIEGLREIYNRNKAVS